MILQFCPAVLYVVYLRKMKTDARKACKKHYSPGLLGGAEFVALTVYL